MNTKHCNCCSTTKPASDFHIRAASIDGLSAKCRDCQRAYDKERAMKPHRAAARLQYSQTERGKEAHRRASRKSAILSPMKKKARSAVGNALRDGKLHRAPCEICSNPVAHAHHDDYSKPLDVRWLCTTHHAEWHKHNTPLCHDQNSNIRTMNSTGVADTGR